MQNFAHNRRLPPINVETCRQNDELRAALERHEGWHGGADPELPRLVVAGGQDSAAVAGATDADRLASEGRLVPHLYGGIETVHIEVDNRAPLAVPGHGLM